MLHKQEAIIIRTIDYSDSSQIFTMITPERGKIGMIAKGLKRPKNPYQSAMQILNYINVVYYQKNENKLSIFKECSICNPFLGIRKNLESIYAALYCTELIREVSQEEQTEEKTFKLLRYSLFKLAEQVSPRNITLYFTWYLLNIEGVLPPLYCCAKCKQSIDLSGMYVFYSNRSVLFCSRCNPISLDAQIKIHGSALVKLYQMLQETPQYNLSTIQYTTQEYQELIALFTIYIQKELEKRTNLFRYLQKLTY